MSFIVSESRLFRDALEEGLKRRGFKAAGSDDIAAKPDDRVFRDAVVIVDMASSGCWATVHAVRACGCEARLMLVNVQDTSGMVAECARVRPAGCALRDCSLDELAALIRRVVGGETVFSASVGALLAGALDQVGDLGHLPLTARERDVLELIKRGYANKEIARALTIEVATVKNHVHRIFLKTGAKRRSELLVGAMKGGTLDVERTSRQAPGVTVHENFN